MCVSSISSAARWPSTTARSRLERQFDRHSFACGVHMQFRPLFGHEPARVLDQSVNLFVVMVRVVVKQTKLFDSGLERERDRIIHTAAPPTEMLLVFSGIVLRIENQQIH